MEGVGNVVAVDGNSVIISTEGARHQYKIPKSRVEGYNGAELFLDISVSNLHSFDVDNNTNDVQSPRQEEDGTRSNTEAIITTTSTADKFGKPVTTKEEEQGLDKKHETTSSSTNKDEKKEQQQPHLEPQMTIKGSESEVSDKPIVKVQDKNIIMSSTESSSPSSLPNSPNTTPTENTIPPQVEVRMKPPNNIEFNPPISAENLSTAMEDGISGAGAANDVRELKEKGKEHRKLKTCPKRKS